jgi:hypothetical protein
MARKSQSVQVQDESIQNVSIVRADELAEVAWWPKLTGEEQAEVVDEGQKLATDMLRYGQSRLGMGLRLSRLKDILEPHNVFQKFLKRYFNMSKRTAYRHIKKYNNVK